MARATDRTKVSAAVIQLASHEEDTAPQQDMSEGDASDSDGSESASDSEQNDPPSSLVADANNMSSCNVLMLRWVQAPEIGDGSREMAIGKVIFLAADMCGSPRPRAGGMLLGSTSHTTTPSESLASLHEVAKCLTMKLAVYLAKEVAAILRAVLTHETKKLYNDSTVHLLCSNYWVQPIYQELLHSSSRRNATRECERKRPSSGLARVTAYAKPPNRRPSAFGTSFRDWIGGRCHGRYHE